MKKITQKIAVTTGKHAGKNVSPGHLWISNIDDISIILATDKCGIACFFHVSVTKTKKIFMKIVTL